MVAVTGPPERSIIPQISTYRPPIAAQTARTLSGGAFDPLSMIVRSVRIASGRDATASVNSTITGEGRYM